MRNSEQWLFLNYFSAFLKFEPLTSRFLKFRQISLAFLIRPFLIIGYCVYVRCFKNSWLIYLCKYLTVRLWKKTHIFLCKTQNVRQNLSFPKFRGFLKCHTLDTYDFYLVGSCLKRQKILLLCWETLESFSLSFQPKGFTLPRTNLLCMKNAGTQWTMVFS